MRTDSHRFGANLQQLNRVEGGWSRFALLRCRGREESCPFGFLDLFQVRIRKRAITQDALTLPGQLPTRSLTIHNRLDDEVRLGLKALNLIVSINTESKSRNLTRSVTDQIRIEISILEGGCCEQWALGRLDISF
jgi:hypothetical protein